MAERAIYVLYARRCHRRIVAVLPSAVSRSLPSRSGFRRVARNLVFSVLCRAAILLAHFAQSSKMRTATNRFDARLANGSFLPRDAMLARYMLSSCVCLSCLSVCPSVHHTPVLYQTTKRIITQTTSCDSAGILLLISKVSAKFQRGYPNGGAKQRRGRLKATIFDQHLAISQKR